MPSYKVIARGFYDSRLYDPEGKRRVLHTDKPLKPMPSWVKPIKAETAADKRKRAAAEKKAAEQHGEDQTDITDASFMGEGEATNVETLG